jgi:hypothetical protein
MWPLTSKQPGGLVIEEELLQTLTCAADQLHGDDADRALPLGRQGSDKRK